MGNLVRKQPLRPLSILLQPKLTRDSTFLLAYKPIIFVTFDPSENSEDLTGHSDPYTRTLSGHSTALCVLTCSVRRQRVLVEIWSQAEQQHCPKNILRLAS